MKLRLWLCLLLLSLGQSVYAGDLRGDTIDLHSYQLKIDLRDFDGHILYGAATIGVKARLNNVREINLDLLKLTVDSVKVNGRAGVYTYDDSLLHIQFAKALNRADSATLTVYYHGQPGVLPGDFGGFYWDERYAFNMGVSFISNPHNYGRVWFPCFDNFEVRSFYEYFITTRATDKAFCNGLLLDVKTEDSAKVWHWKLNESIPSYLASVAVADYETISDTVHGINGTIPVEIAVAAEDTAALRKRFEHLHQAFHILEHYWGPYRWERVGYCMVPFQDGAMEHATNIAFMKYYLDAYARECETTMAHELSHHWFGNLVTCASAPEMWLNEGWATYSQSLFIEGLYGADSARQYRREAHLNEVQLAHVGDGGYLPVSGVPSKQTYGSTVYQKGGDVIHTLRYYLGDSIFFSCVKGYLNKYAFNTASTIQLRDYLSECSGKDLTDFFKDWVLAPGYPHFSISDKYISAAKGKYEVYINIRQRLSHAPEFYNRVPVTVSYFDKHLKRKDEVVYVSGECTTYATELDFKPEYIALDFDENLAQAITTDWHVVRDSGGYDFGVALMSIKVDGVKDSSLIRVEHNWIPAEAMIHPINGLHLHKSRYWTVDGVFDPTLKATGIFEYSAGPSDHLDAGFITNEDSLVMMYRPNQNVDWKPAKNYTIDRGDNDSDKVGVVIVYPLKKGEYALAIRDMQQPTETGKANSCELLRNSLKKGRNFEATLDKVNELMLLAFEKNIFDRVEVDDSRGNKITEQNIGETENKLAVKLSHTATESYIVTLRPKSGGIISKKANNQ
jgi:aminopeptidase N